MKPSTFLTASAVFLATFAASAQKKKNKDHGDIVIGKNIIKGSETHDHATVLIAPLGIDKNKDGNITGNEQTGVALQVMRMPNVVIVESIDGQDGTARLKMTRYLGGSPQDDAESNTRYTQASIDKNFTAIVDNAQNLDGFQLLGRMRDVIEDFKDTPKDGFTKLFTRLKTPEQDAATAEPAKTPSAAEQEFIVQQSWIANAEMAKRMGYTDVKMIAADMPADKQAVMMFDAKKGTQTDRVLFMVDAKQSKSLMLTVPHATDSTLLVSLGGYYDIGGNGANVAFTGIEIDHGSSRNVNAITPTQKGVALLDGIMDITKKRHDATALMTYLILNNGEKLSEIEKTVATQKLEYQK